MAYHPVGIDVLAKCSALIPLSILALGLSGCESEEEIAAEMERSLLDSSDALVGALLSAEIMHQVSVPPDTTLRHGTSTCGCPCTQRVGTGLPYVLTLDYADYGCVPDSDLLPTSLSGHAVLEYDGEGCDITWDRLLLALEHEVTGDLTGDADSEHVAPAGALSVGPWSGTLALDIAIDADSLRIDGEVSSGPADDVRTVRFDRVRLPRAAIGGRCPTPESGTATLLHERSHRKDVVVQFARPGDGSVTLSRGDRVSEPTDWCSYASTIW